MTEILDRCGRYLSDIFFPNRCPFCGKFIMWNEYVCRDCDEKLERADDVICRKCGRRECMCDKPHEYDMVFAALFYNKKTIRKAIVEFKLIGDENIARYAAEDIACHMDQENIPKPDFVVPVPMGRKKQRRRGHNQAAIFAKCLGKRLGVPVRNDIIFKYDTKDEQHAYGREERKERVKILFFTKNVPLDGKTVCLCDDVMTTGSTLNECAALLKALGAVSVIAAVCASAEIKTSMEEGT